MLAGEQDNWTTSAMGLRFHDPSVERDYQTWFVDRALPFSRVGIIGAIAAWLTAIATTAIMTAHDQLLVLWTGMFILMPVLAGALALTFNASARPHVQTIVASANALSGLASTYLCFAFTAPRADLAMGLLITTAFFAFTIFRLDPVRAAAAVSTYAALFLVLLLQLASQSSAALSAVQVIAYLVITVNAVGVGAFACIAMNAVSRDNFRQQRIIERQRVSIDDEKSRSDRLIASILPDAVSERLKGEPGMIADHYPFVSVVFADLVGFTELATRLTPDTLVSLLNDLFSRFDDLAAEHGVERIKTIGDAYMAAAGVPTQRPDYAVAVARFALAVRQAVRDYSSAHGQELAIRIGIGSGAVVAGVVGTTRFAYDLWGDTVNVASRMESQGEAGAIQVCARTHALLADRFKFESRGELDVTGRGRMQTYFLLDLA